jgi:hypothetical protein
MIEAFVRENEQRKKNSKRKLRGIKTNTHRVIVVAAK